MEMFSRQLLKTLDDFQRDASGLEYLPIEIYNRHVDINKELKSLLLGWIGARNDWLNEVASGNSARYGLIMNDTLDVLACFSDMLSSIDSLGWKYGQ